METGARNLADRRRRIEECIQRYRARRKMDPERNNLFDKYLFLGGLDPSPRQFTGADPEELAGANAAEIRQATATDCIYRGGGGGSKFYDPTRPDGWVVDFEGVVKGFL